MVELTIGT